MDNYESARRCEKIIKSSKLVSMKIKDFEGSPEEINNFFQNNGLDISNYLSINPDKKVDKIWIFILIGLFIIFNIIICMIEQSNKFYLPITILAIGSIGGLITIIQLNHEKWIVSTIIGVIGLIIMVVSFKILTPKDTIKEVKDKSVQYLDSKTQKVDEK